MKVRIAGGFRSSGTGRSSEKIPTYGHGRVCETTGCDTVLSSYNPAHHCSVHVALSAPRLDLRPAERPLTT